MNNDSSHPATPPDEQLVAYLDGELDPESSRHIEELLASDAQVRRRLQEMERTWDLLDDLDAAPAGNQLAQSTLEMVAVAARRTSSSAWSTPRGGAAGAGWRWGSLCWRPPRPASSPFCC